MKSNKEILLLIQAIIDFKAPLISNLSNVASLLYKIKGTSWAGFYIVNNDYLYLGPFQGEPACLKINIGRGVCGQAFLKKNSIIVHDVHKFIDHIACDSKSNSEIVVPIIKNNEVKAVIDLDSYNYNNFNDDTLCLLLKVADLLKDLFI